jgi:hypothetical protein
VLCGCPQIQSKKDISTFIDNAELSLVSYVRAVQDRDYAKIRALMSRQLRPDCGGMLAEHQRFGFLAKLAAKDICGKFGQDFSLRFRKGIYKTYDQMLEGVLLWAVPPGKDYLSKVRLVFDEQKMVIWSHGTPNGLLMIQEDDNWVIGFDDERAKEKYLNAYRSELQEVNETIEKIIQGIYNGAIHNENIDKVLTFEEVPLG